MKMKLRSRYGDIWNLEEIDEGYKMKIPDYTRFGLFPDSEDELCFIDPPGGPFLEVGKNIFPSEMIIGIHNTEDGYTIIKTNRKHNGKQNKETI